MDLDPYIAVTRFGLGARPGDLSAIKDSRAWLTQQITTPIIPPAIQSLAFSKEGQAQLVEYQQRKKSGEKGMKKDLRQIYLRHTSTRFSAQVETQQPFIERLVMFWSNHFTVSVQKPIVAPLVNQYEAEAIRPHINGKFSDMLIAVAKHPAMLMYLDNFQSIGPNSLAGQRRNRGLNENLAREILELHTLGVGSGYTQNDVLALAKIITGWSLNRETGGFAFQSRMHEPGSKVVLGKSITEQGEAEGLQVLRMLAIHPATARHISTKLARHFIADDPPASAIQKLTDSFLRSGGSLMHVYKTLIALEEPWRATQAKIKTPYEYAVSAYRLLQVKPEPRPLAQSLEALNYRVFSAASPAGYADVASAWLSPDGLLKRIEWAKVFAQNKTLQINPLALAEQVMGPVMNAETAFIIKGAASPQDGLAFLISSPEFQRR